MSLGVRRGQALLLVVVTGLVVVSSVAAVGGVAPNRQKAPQHSLSDTNAAANQAHPAVTNVTPPTREAT